MSSFILFANAPSGKAQFQAKQEHYGCHIDLAISLDDWAIN